MRILGGPDWKKSPVVGGAEDPVPPMLALQAQVDLHE